MLDADMDMRNVFFNYKISMMNRLIFMLNGRALTGLKVHLVFSKIHVMACGAGFVIRVGSLMRIIESPMGQQNRMMHEMG